MAMLNNSSKSWTLLNYVNAFKMYIPDYNTLFELRDSYNIEPLMLAAICTKGTSSVVTGSQLLKSGNFKITNTEIDYWFDQLIKKGFSKGALFWFRSIRYKR